MGESHSKHAVRRLDIETIGKLKEAHTKVCGAAGVPRARQGAAAGFTLEDLRAHLSASAPPAVDDAVSARVFRAMAAAGGAGKDAAQAAQTVGFQAFAAAYSTVAHPSKSWPMARVVFAALDLDGDGAATRDDVSRWLRSAGNGALDEAAVAARVAELFSALPNSAAYTFGYEDFAAAFASKDAVVPFALQAAVLSLLSRITSDSLQQQQSGDAAADAAKKERAAKKHRHRHKHAPSELGAAASASTAALAAAGSAGATDSAAKGSGADASTVTSGMASSEVARITQQKQQQPMSPSTPQKPHHAHKGSAGAATVAGGPITEDFSDSDEETRGKPISFRIGTQQAQPLGDARRELSQVSFDRPPPSRGRISDARFRTISMIRPPRAAFDGTAAAPASPSAMRTPASPESKPLPQQQAPDRSASAGVATPPFSFSPAPKEQAPLAPPALADSTSFFGAGNPFGETSETKPATSASESFFGDSADLFASAPMASAAKPKQEDPAAPVRQSSGFDFLLPQSPAKPATGPTSEEENLFGESPFDLAIQQQQQQKPKKQDASDTPQTEAETTAAPVPFNPFDVAAEDSTPKAAQKPSEEAAPARDSPKPPATDPSTPTKAASPEASAASVAAAVAPSTDFFGLSSIPAADSSVPRDIEAVFGTSDFGELARPAETPATASGTAGASPNPFADMPFPKKPLPTPGAAAASPSFPSLSESSRRSSHATWSPSRAAEELMAVAPAKSASPPASAAEPWKPLPFEPAEQQQQEEQEQQQQQAPASSAEECMRGAMAKMEAGNFREARADVRQALSALKTQSAPGSPRAIRLCVVYDVALRILEELSTSEDGAEAEKRAALGTLLAGLPVRKAHRRACLLAAAVHSDVAARCLAAVEPECAALSRVGASQPAAHNVLCHRCQSLCDASLPRCFMCGAPVLFCCATLAPLTSIGAASKCATCSATFSKSSLPDSADPRCPICGLGDVLPLS